MCNRYATDGDMGLEKSESPSKIIRVQTLRSEFGLDLTYENLGQRVTGTPYWRGVRISLRGPRRRVFRAKFMQIVAATIHRLWLSDETRP